MTHKWDGGGKGRGRTVAVDAREDVVAVDFATAGSPPTEILARYTGSRAEDNTDL